MVVRSSVVVMEAPVVVVGVVVGMGVVMVAAARASDVFVFFN